MRVRQRDYELMFVVSPMNFGEESLNNVFARVQQGVATAGGEVISMEHSAPWGRRKLAYPIRASVEGEASRRQFTEGYYVLARLSLPTTGVAVVERQMRLNNAVLRHLLLTPEDQASSLIAADSGPVADNEDDDEGDEDEDS